MRLFSAIGVPDDVAQHLSVFRGGLHDAKWVDPADFHVTLAFFGDIDATQADDLAEALGELGAPTFDVRLTGLGVFGSDKPHAIVALAEKTPLLLSLEAAHRSICHRLGIRLESRRYTPHVTLGRLRRTLAGEVAGWLGEQPAFPDCAWMATRFAIYSSRTSRGGGPYVAEFEFPLAEAGA